MVRSNLYLIDQGIDPFEQRQKALVPTFHELAMNYIESYQDEWKNPTKAAAIRIRLLEKHIFPSIGRHLVSDIQPRDVLKILLRFWNEKPATAKKIRQSMAAVMNHAVDEGYREDNPAGKIIVSVLPRPTKKQAHYPAGPYAEVAAVLRAVEDSGARTCTKLSFKFMVLTAARVGEIRGARWSEIALAKRLWIVPAERMKAKKEHRVPLSFESIAILEQARVLCGQNELVFPSPTGDMLSDATHSKLLRTLGLAWVPHGFRSSFRDWCGESGVPWDVAEECLSHTTGNATELSYKRSDLLNRRRVVMDNWARYLHETAGSLSHDGGDASDQIAHSSQAYSVSVR